jgi:DNA-directed RNA polymerase subunit RPC12/RpoP
MLVQGIKSRPVYPGFTVALPAQRHLFALEGDGALALLDLVAPGHAVLERAEILYAPAGPAASVHAAALDELGAADCWIAPSAPTLINRLGAMLATATMSTRLYAAGTEPFIGAVVRLGADFGIKHSSIIKEHRGSAKRRVQCVHCKGFLEDVTTSPVRCTHCGLHLLVRDHFSRRLNAFQGVCVHAEEPDVIPPAEELFA